MMKQSAIPVGCLGCILAFVFPFVPWLRAIDVDTAVERDWVLSASLAAGSLGAITTQADALGGVDGIKNGSWGFHTGNDKTPWWQVDLLQAQPLARVIIWNRCDAADRALGLQLKVSSDGQGWSTVYAHDGTTFAGVTGNGPLKIPLTNVAARFVRIQLPRTGFLHLDEVEVYATADPRRNIALSCPAEQSSTSQWSVSHRLDPEPDWHSLTVQTLHRSGGELDRAPFPIPPQKRFTRQSYMEARHAFRERLLRDPLLDFDDLLFVKRIPGTYSHMSDQYYGWWSRPGGGLFILKNWKSQSQTLVNLTPQFAPGSFLKPELSHDGTRILFSYARFYKGVRDEKDKTQKRNLPEDAFYHIYEMNVDGSGLRQLSRGRYDDFNPRYLPDGQIVFLSTRRGTFIQTGKCAAETIGQGALPDSYVRCGGGNFRPVAVYTLHLMDSRGGNLRGISPFENFEWDPVVANDGRVVYARWDYVDRDNMPYMSLWSTNPDGTNPQLVYGNHTRAPHFVSEARPVPNSRKFVFTASAHHSISGGSLCLLDTDYGNENAAPIQRLTPEVAFPEIESWPSTWYATPFPLSEKLFLTAWSPTPLEREGRRANAPNSLGLYLYHASGARELIYRDPDISSCDPLPLRARPLPPSISSDVAWDGSQEGRFLIADVYRGLDNVPRGSVKALRVVGVPAKVQPQMNTPLLGVTADDPGKFILGTAPVEPDGSAHFRVPSGVNIFFQALDDRGSAIQTMRTVTYVQPGQTLSCVGCHEHRSTAPRSHTLLAAHRPPSRLAPAPSGAWPFRFDQLVQPVIDAKCVRCHQPGAENLTAARYNLLAAKSYDALVGFGQPSLREHIRRLYLDGASRPGEGLAQNSTLLRYLDNDQVHKALLGADDRQRLVTWIDVYAQRLGSFSEQQEQELIELRTRMADLLAEAEPP